MYAAQSQYHAINIGVNERDSPGTSQAEAKGV